MTNKMRSELGKIQKVKFGMGGYQDAMIGFSFDLGGVSWGVGDFWGCWSDEHTEHCKWTEEDRLKSLGKSVMRVSKLMEEARAESLEGLVGIPVRIYFKDFNTLSHWEILREVM